MLDDGPLLAPGCYPLPPSVRPAEVLAWFARIEIPLVCEVFTLGSKSVLYEMALYRLRRPWQKQACSPGLLAALMQGFEAALQCFDLQSLLLESRMLFKNHLEAGLNCVRFRPALELLLPPDQSQPADPDQLVPPAHHGDAMGPTGHCVAEEVDRERWVFRDVAVDWRPPPGMGSSDASGGGAVPAVLWLGGHAKLAYSVALFLWAAARLLARRIELLLEFPQDHPLFAHVEGPQVMTVHALGDSLETLLLLRREVSQAAVRLCYQGNWEEALTKLGDAMAMYPDGDEGQYAMHVHRANCYLHLHQPQRAVEDCTTALRRNPHSFLALHRRAQAYEELGQPAAAMADVAQLRHLFPGSKEAEALHAWLAAPPDTNPGPDGRCTRPPPPRELRGATTAVAAEPQADSPAAVSDSPASPLTPLPSSSGCPLSFASALLHIDLANLPPHQEPDTVDDPPFLARYLEGEAELQYTVCPGKELGRGASCRVYKAVHPTAGYLMAVKEMETRHLEEETELLEAYELVWSMKHTNVIRTLGLRRVPGFYHIVLEYCPGGTLRSLANGLHGLPPPLVRKYAVEVLRGLRYMHRHGLLHRDVKGSNVLLRDDGTARIGDLGTCMRIPDGEVRCSRVMKGTVLWMAPEAFRGRYSTASTQDSAVRAMNWNVLAESRPVASLWNRPLPPDVWSFGCTLIEMVTAKDPWHEQRFKEQLLAMVFIATRPDALPATPPALAEDELGRHFFHCCVARSPAERVSPDLLLRHPWLNRPALSPSRPPPGPISAGIAKAEAQNAWHDCSNHWNNSSNPKDPSFGGVPSPELLSLTS